MIQKIILSREEKKLLHSKVIQFWQLDDLTIANYQKINQTIKLPITLTETMMLHYENMHALGDLLKKLVFKGGTAVQHYINSTLQRGSVDLDFNTSIGHPSVLLEAVKNLNKELEDKENILTISGIEFGKFLFEHEDTNSGTLTFTRIVPTKLNEFIKIGEKVIQGKKTKIQINYKHSWLPGIEIRKEKINLFPNEIVKPIKSVTVPIESPGDLIADKILTLTQLGDFGRERLKDVYDLINLGALQKEKGKFSIASQKLDTIAKAEGLQKNNIVTSALDHLDEMKTLTAQVIGFKSQVGFEGWEIIDNWEKYLDETIDLLESELTK